MSIIAVIPARSGSKSLRDKNIRPIAGIPLMSHSILQAKNCQLVDRVIVSTDSEEYAEIARDYGSEVPFLRPKEISGDFSTDLEVFKHALQWLQKEEGQIPAICVHLRPTHPYRKEGDLRNCIEKLLANPEADSLRSLGPVPETPYKMWKFDNGDYIRPILEDSAIKEAHSMPRQSLPMIYMQNASIDVIRSKTILDKNSMTGDKVLGYKMYDNFDIDNENHFRRAELKLISQNDSIKRTFCFDIDGVIATIVEDNNYRHAGPIDETISLINLLHSRGNRIVLNTARGSMTGLDWKEITVNQLNDWGVKYDELYVGQKPAADYYIDDKFIELNLLNEILSNNEKE